ncbi:Flagellum-specific ATP synthase [Vibrio chagasii]|nr:Flagellum-specific ATP synthase [Vibrio chagasii]
MEQFNRLKSADFNQSVFRAVGHVVNSSASAIDVKGLTAPLGARCVVESGDAGYVYADVVGFSGTITKLQAVTQADGVTPNAKVRLYSKIPKIAISDSMKGVVIDPTGKVLIGEHDRNNNSPESHVPILSPALSVSDRGIIDKQLLTGVKAIDSMLPLGVGQRIGLFAGTGVGKSVLMSMITKNADADIVVIGLVGERGREVSEFYHETLTEEARLKSIIVAAPADTSAILRMQCAETATAIAEHYRDKGQNVLLLLDSVTRYAQAQREVALSNGEPPATKGYPPSVFSKLPKLIERTGKTNYGGSITAIYTVLTEGDDMNDPIADAARGVLDGHIVLSRSLAGRGIYPAIEVTSSISRLSHVLQTQGVRDVVSRIKASFQTLEDNKELISMGVVESGKNIVLDKAIKNESALWGMVKQNVNDNCGLQDSLKELSELAHKI